MMRIAVLGTCVAVLMSAREDISVKKGLNGVYIAIFI